MSNTDNLITLAVMILLPIIPAVILFKALSSTADVEGNVANKKVKFGGAFAGYFGVLLLVFGLRSGGWLTPDHPPTYEIWQVTGSLVDETGAPIEALRQDQFLVAPSAFVDQGVGHFEVTVFTKPGPTGKTEFPMLSIAYPPYTEVPINLAATTSAAVSDDSIQIVRDEASRNITLSPIHLKKKLGPYNGAGTPPAIVTAGNPQ